MPACRRRRDGHDQRHGYQPHRQSGGGHISSSENSAVVAGSNSVWPNRSNLNIGFSGSSNRVAVTAGGTIGSGTVIHVGLSGASNQLIVSRCVSSACFNSQTEITTY